MSTVPNKLDLAPRGTHPGNAQPAWKQELNEKIAAARARRQSAQQGPESGAQVKDAADSRAARVAAAVAARYAEAPSYSEYLASQVRAAMMAAVAAQAAANEARAAADAAQVAVQEAEQIEMPAIEPAPVSVSRALPPPAPIVPRVDHAASGFQYATQSSIPAAHAVRPDSAETPRSYPPAAHVFSDPVQDEMIAPATPLPAKLLEFPRELVASRKARPRHAEGPLRDGVADETGQLRIFEVESSAISTEPEAAPQATEWSSIRLDAYPSEFSEDGRTAVTARNASSSHKPAYNQRVAQVETHPAGRLSSQALQAELLPGVAGLTDRLMAAIVDAALVGIAFTLFVLVFAASTAHPPAGKPALIGGALVFALFYLLYQFMFFTYADGTPGMRYARIALCTFDDDNPTREAMRKRIFALVLAAAPLGLGFLYALFDDDHLAWHDRMTQMYQRSYK